MSDRPDRFQALTAVAIAVTTALTALLALMQADAAGRDDRGNRDSKRYATEALGRQVAGDARTNYDYYTAFQAWNEYATLAEAARGRGDGGAARRFEKLQKSVEPLTPLLAPPYLDAAKQEADVARWEAETYVEQIAALREKYVAASGVKEAWDAKANTYIVHLTLMAVALALFGLSATLAGVGTRALFTAVAGVLVGVATLWAGLTWLAPVPDLREKKGAIEAYAQGAGLAHRERWDEAAKAYTEALGIAPDYVQALTARAEAWTSLGKRAEAAADYEKALALGDGRAWVAGSLAWIQYEQGRFKEAVETNRKALERGPDELWIQFDLGLAQLAAGDLAGAQATYQAGAEQAARMVAEAKAARREAPSLVWESLEDAGQSLDGLIEVIDGDGSEPPKDKLAQARVVRPEAEKLLRTVKSLAVGLEYGGAPPAGSPSTGIGELRFAAAGAEEEAESFPDETPNVALRFDYQGLKDGQLVVIKVYLEGEEDPAWRFAGPWDQGAAGTAERLLAPAQGASFVMPSGEYHVEVYVDGHLAQRGSFEVAAGAAD